MQKVLLLAMAGALGTLARYGLGGLAQRLFGPAFPWGTLTVNTVGCFAFGLIWAASQERGLISPEMRSIALIGFMGAFTTFSTYVAESGQLLADREMLLATANLAVQVVAGLGVFFLGQAVGRVI